MPFLLHHHTTFQQYTFCAVPLTVKHILLEYTNLREIREKYILQVYVEYFLKSICVAASKYWQSYDYWFYQTNPFLSPTVMFVILILYYQVLIFSAYAMMPVHLSICLSVTFVHCGHRVRWILDIFACLDRWMSLLLTDNAWPGSSDGMMPGFLVEEGGVWKKW